MARVKTLTEFRQKLRGGGARPNLFEVDIPRFPFAVRQRGNGGPNVWKKDNHREEFKFMCKAAQLPASTVAPVEIPFRGRILKVAGDRTFADWTITIINDENFKLRSAFEQWSNTMTRLDNGMGPTRPGDYMCNAFVRQLGRGDEQNDRTGVRAGDNRRQDVLRTYKFFDIFPTEVSSIEVSYDSTNTVEEFTVTFAVQYFEIGKKKKDGGNGKKNAERPYIR